MNRKLDFLAKYDENLTIAQLKQAVVEEERKSAEKEQQEIQEVKGDFQKRYFRYLDEDSIFGGRELNIFKFKTLKSFEKSMDWEFIYYFNGTIRWVYLVDAIIEMLFLTWWIVIFIRSVRKN